MIDLCLALYDKSYNLAKVVKLDVKTKVCTAYPLGEHPLCFAQHLAAFLM